MTHANQPPRTLRRDAAVLVGHCPAWNSRLAARRLTQFMDAELAPCGLTLAQLGLMAQVAASADDRLGALARRTGLDPSTLSRNLRTLEKDGLVEIAAAEKDQRRRAVWLTETGARRLETALPLWRAAQEKLASRLAPEPVLTLAAATEALTREAERTESRG